MKPKHQRKSLTFGQIADEWSEEPGGLPRDETAALLTSAMWLGDFEDATGSTCLTLKTGSKKPEPFNRRHVLTAFRDFSRETLTLMERRDKFTIWPAAFTPDIHATAVQMIKLGGDSDEDWESMKEPPWEDARDLVPWEALAALRWGDYDEPFRAVYLEQLVIAKGEFRRLCLRRGLDLPSFWFSDDERRAGSTADAGEADTGPSVTLIGPPVPQEVEAMGVSQFGGPSNDGAQDIAPGSVERRQPAPDNARPARGGVGRKPSSQGRDEAIWKAFDERAGLGFSFKRGEFTTVANAIADKVGYKSNSIQKMIRDRYKELRRQQTDDERVPI